MKILLAIDGSGLSEAAVEDVARRCCAPECEVRVISVVELNLPLAYAGGGEIGGSLYADLERAAQDRAHAVVDKAAAVLRASHEGHPVVVTTQVLTGSPKRIILADAATFGADLIVVGSHGYGALDRFFLGSVSQAVALHAGCSVEIVRRRNSKASGGG